METNPAERMYLQTQNLAQEIESRRKPEVPSSGMMAPRKTMGMHNVALVFAQLNKKRMERQSA